MWLDPEFIRLPLLFDVEALQAEIAQFGDDDWVGHPTGYLGSASVVLVSPHGGISDDFAIAGPMQPTPHLARCPYIRQVLATLGAPISRTRLMRLSAGQAVPPHVDDNYHWWRRMRIHVPVATHPTVAFHCGERSVHMGAGECWAFNNDLVHRVVNPSAVDRVHLVADTRGSGALRRLLGSGRRGMAPVLHVVAPLGDVPAPALEPYVFRVLEPDEVDSLVAAVWEGARCALATSQAFARLRAHLDAFSSDWRGAFGRGGHDRRVELEYAGIIHSFVGRFPSSFRRGFAPGGAAARALNVIATVLQTTNRSEPLMSIRQAQRQHLQEQCVPFHEDAPYEITVSGRGQVHAAAWSCSDGDWQGSERAPLCAILGRFGEPGPVRPRDVLAPGERTAFQDLVEAQLVERIWERLPRFDRPVFILCAPRSGSSALFEALARSAGWWSVGRESDDIFAAALAMAGDSDVIAAAAANAEAERRLRAEFVPHLRDHRQRRLASLAPTDVPSSLRLLEKTPRNALRVAFLDALWPDARFIYLYRDPAESIGSIMEAWRSGGFVTQADLPGWTAGSWSLLLPPDWRRLDGRSLGEVAAFQWRSANSAIMDALGSIEPGRWTSLDYEQLLLAPRATLRRLSEFADVPHEGEGSDEDLPGGSPMSQHTVSAPARHKWRREAETIEPLLGELAPVVERFRTLQRQPAEAQAWESQKIGARSRLML